MSRIETRELTLLRFIALAVVAALATAGCRGEPRPNVEVIGGADTVSVSASSIAPPEDAPGPAAVGQAQAILAGNASTARPEALLALAASREREFRLEGKLAAPLGASLAAASAESKGYINAVLYLSTLRSASLLQADATPAAREAHLAEARAYWQAIRTVAAGGSPAASQAVDAAMGRSPATLWTADDTAAIYAHLNNPAVLRALGIPPTLQVATPPAA